MKTSLIRSDRKPLWELIPLAQPLRINIDPCDLCNFKCDFCFQSKSRSFNGCLMKNETFERVINQIKEFDNPVNVVQLFCLGEPLINKHIPEYIRRIRKEGVSKEVKITSNGSLLTHELTDRILAEGIDEFVISLNGLDDDDFLRITNTYVSFDKLRDNVEYMYTNRGNCHVHIKIVGDYFSEEKVKRFLDLFSPISDTINVDGATDHWPGLTSEFKHQQYDTGGRVEKTSICALCFYELAIHSDGTVSPCVADWMKDKQNLGNVYDSTLKQIWNSEIRKRLLLSYLKGEEIPYYACRECEYPSSGVSVNLEPYREEILKKYV